MRAREDREIEWPADQVERWPAYEIDPLRDRPRPFHCKHEPCWYVVRKGSTASWVGDHAQTTLWQIDKNLKSETGHGAQKPVECMRRPIENNASPGQAVYEPFSGSGTTIIAAEMTGRVCHAIGSRPSTNSGWKELRRPRPRSASSTRSSSS
jgi:hypothetical protein